MKWTSIHNGREIPYWLGVLIGLDQFAGALVPGAEIDRTISHRLGVKRVRQAVKEGRVVSAQVMRQGRYLLFRELRPEVVEALLEVRIPFHRHPLAAAIDYFLEKIDPGHSIRAIGY